MVHPLPDVTVKRPTHAAYCKLASRRRASFWRPLSWPFQGRRPEFARIFSSPSGPTTIVGRKRAGALERARTRHGTWHHERRGTRHRARGGKRSFVSGYGRFRDASDRKRSITAPTWRSSVARNSRFRSIGAQLFRSFREVILRDRSARDLNNQIT